MKRFLIEILMLPIGYIVVPMLKVSKYVINAVISMVYHIYEWYFKQIEEIERNK